MQCKDWRELITESIDEKVSAEIGDRIEQHRMNCPSCRQYEEELQWIRTHCRSLEVIPARMETWKTIRNQMRSEGLLNKQSAETRTEEIFLLESLRRQMFFYRRMAYGAIAACLVLFGFGVGSFRMVRSQLLSATQLPYRQLEVQWAVLQLEKAISRVAPVLDKSRAELQPELRQMVDANLETLNKAIAESERALAKDPNDEEAGIFLIQACQKKLSVMHSFLEMNGI